MKKVTTVLTVLALAALVAAPRPVRAADTTALNQSLAAQAKAAAPTADEQALFAAINAQRAANGVPPLNWGIRLAAAARYQEADQIADNFYGPFAYQADGRTQVDPAQLAADFGTSAAVTGDSEFSSVFTSNFGDWPSLVNDWRRQDSDLAAMLGSASVNVGGLSIVSSTDRSGAVTYRWALVYGYNPAFGTAAGNSPAPTLDLSGLDPALAAQAQAAPMTPDEQALLAAINQSRALEGAPALTPGPALTAAAHYQALEQLKLGFLAPLAYGADGTTPVAPGQLAADFASAAANVQDYAATNDAAGGRYLAWTVSWPRQVGLWASQDAGGFGAMLGSGAVNVCGIAVVQTGTATAASGVPYPVYAYSLIVGRR